ncbi:glycosyltransferase family 2 protein [Chlamydiota bacterium]
MNDITKPLITTIIPTYRRPTLLRRAIKSVLNQTYPNFQVCVYDNASGDETADVVSEFSKNDPRIKYHCHPKNIGALNNFNYGMQRVNTPFFSFLSDDDLLLPEFYETALEGFENHPKAIFSSTLTLYGDDHSNIWSSFIFNWTPGFYQPPDGLLSILKNGHPTWTGILFRREVIEKAGILNSNIGGASDLDFELRAAAQFPFVISLKPGAIFVSHPASLCAQAGFSHIWPGWLNMYRKIKENKQIPLEARTYAAHLLTERTKKELYFIWLRSIANKNFKDGIKASDILSNHYHLKTMAFFLSKITKLCAFFPAICNLSILLFKIRRFVSIKKLKYLQNGEISSSISEYIKTL